MKHRYQRKGMQPLDCLIPNSYSALIDRTIRLGQVCSLVILLLFISFSTNAQGVVQYPAGPDPEPINAGGDNPIPPDLSEATNFAILAGSKVESNCSVFANGMVGANTTISAGVQAANGAFDQGSGTVPGALDNLQTARQYCLSLTPENINQNLSGQVLEAGVFEISGNAVLTSSESLTFKGDSTSVFIINIDGDLTLDSLSFIKLEGVWPQNIFWNVGKSTIVKEDAAYYGIFMSNDDITISGPTQGTVSLLSQNGTVYINDQNHPSTGSVQFYSIERMAIESSQLLSSICAPAGSWPLLDPNLILNPSFEDRKGCPNGYDTSVNNICHWISAINALDTFQSTPDYFCTDYSTNCNAYTNPTNGVPNNFQGFQAARNSGKSYPGIVPLNVTPGYREYLRQDLPLDRQLKHQRYYYGEFYVNLSNKSGIAVSKLGMLASVNQPAFTGPKSFVLAATPQIQSNIVLDDKIDWVKVSGSFQASGGENTIIIGNFNDDDNSGKNILPGYFPPYHVGSSYYYIEDVALYEVPFAGHNPTVCANSYTLGSGILLPSHLGTITYTWNVNGNFYANGLSITVSPSQTTTYNLTVTVNGAVVGTSSVTVPAALQVSAGPNQTICLGNQATLTASGAATYTWTGGGQTYTGATITVSPTTTTTYTVTGTASNGCTATSQVTVTVDTPQPIDAGPDFTICIDADPLELYALIEQGPGSQTGTWVWSGPGVSSNSSTPAGPVYSFSPHAAGPGNHAITLTFTTPNGCISTDTKVITVVDAPGVGITPMSASVNQAAAPFSLIGDFDPPYSPGTWSGPGINASGVFNPGIAGVGTHTIYYTVSGYSCTGAAQATITVTQAPVFAGVDQDMCLYADGGSLNIFNLNSLFQTPQPPYPSGGTWSGPDLTGTIFTPKAAGTFTFEYIVEVVTYSAGSPYPTISEISDFVNITVHNPVITMPATYYNYNADDPAFALDASFATPAGGTWSGGGVSGQPGNYSFNPAEVTPGKVYILSYAYTDAFGCSVSKEMEVGVKCPQLPLSMQDLNTSGSGTTIINNSGSPNPVVYDQDHHIKGQLVLVNGTFEIKNGATFYISGGGVSQLPYSSACHEVNYYKNRVFITVGQNAVLRIENNATLMAACNSMWGGILVLDGGRVEVSNSTIRDAFYGVLSMPVNCTANGNVNGNSVSVTGSYILDCLNGVQIYDNGIGKLNPITQTTFKISPYSIRDGIQPWGNGNGFDQFNPMGLGLIDGNYYNAAVNGNTFDGHTLGMKAKGTGLVITGNTFKNFGEAGLEVTGEVNNNYVLNANVSGNFFYIPKASGFARYAYLSGYEKYGIINHGRADIKSNLFRNPTLDNYFVAGFPSGIRLEDGQHSVVEKNTFEHLQHGVVYNRENFGSQFTAPKIVDNLFSNVMGGIFLPDRGSLTGAVYVTSTLRITCNTFKYNYNQIGRKGYGIRVGYLPQDGGGVYKHSIVFDAIDQVTGLQLNATMKNNFLVTGSTGTEKSEHSVFEFVDVASHDNNLNFIDYKTFNRNYTNNGITMAGTHAGRVTKEGKISVIDGDPFEDNVNDCLNTQGEGFENGVNKRQAKPTTSGTGKPAKPAQEVKVKLSNYPNPFFQQTTVEYVLPAPVREAEIQVYSAITGKVVKQQPVSVNEQSVLLNVPELKPGLYIYMLIADGKVLATDKMLILNHTAYE